jgi:hypothetical protein
MASLKRPERIFVHQFQKHFTIEEARALLPSLRQIFADAHRRRDRVMKADAHLSQQASQQGADLGGPDVNSMLMDAVQMNRQIRGVLKLGIQIKDFDRGLVDFPHLKDGREVFLCWELEEDDIEFWHDLDAGYSGRERL